MTDKKLTDGEIVKALECCLDISPSTCKNCSLFNVTNSTMVCSKIATKFALDLIIRQQTEIERLNALVKTKNKLIEGLDQSISYTYDRAIKEFAERLKEKSDSRFDYSELVFEISEEDIDNLVKEMVGEDNA